MIKLSYGSLQHSNETEEEPFHTPTTLTSQNP